MGEETSILKKRVYAFTVDFAVIVATNYFLMASFNQFIKTIFFHLSTNTQMLLIKKVAIVSSLSMVLLTFTYFSLFYFLTNGQTLGKSFLKLKVSCPSGQEITLQQAMTRALAHFICAMTGSFLFALSFIRKDGKSLADVLSGTTVEDTLAKTELSLIITQQQPEEGPLSSTEDKEAA